MHRTFPVVTWGERKVTFRLATDGYPLPNDAPAVLVFAFLDGKMALADITGRGWCVPSGRIEAGESLETAAIREAREEAAIEMDRLIPFGTTVEVQDGRAERPLAAAYVARVIRLDEFVPTAESREMRLVTRQELSDCYYLWDALTEAVFDAAWEISRLSTTDSPI